MPGYWPFYIYLFIYFHFFFGLRNRVTVHKQQIRDPHTRMLGVSKHIEVDKNACAKKRTRPISNLDPCAYAVWARKSSGVETGPISSHLDRKSLIYHMAKNRTLYCPRVLLWTMTCNHWKVFSEWHGFKGWHGFVPVSKLGLVKCQTLARRRPRWRTISSDCTWPALVKMEKRNCFT